MICRVCGCSDFEACVLLIVDDVVITCYWAGAELCSGCVSRPVTTITTGGVL